MASFHTISTATLIPKGIGADDWRMDHTGPGGDYSLIQSDADDLVTLAVENDGAADSGGIRTE